MGLIEDQLLVVASLPRRLLAYVVDLLLLTPLTVGLYAPRGSLVWMVAVPAWPIAYVGYLTVAVTRYGQTLGMRVLRIRVVSMADGRKPSWLRSLLRSLLQAVGRPVPPLALGAPLAILVYGPVFFSRYSRGLHDFAGRTVVVEATLGLRERSNA